MSTDKLLRRGPQRRQENKPLPDEFEQRKAVVDRRTENNRQFATFYLEDHYLGIDIGNVQEVFQSKKMTPVPMSSAAVAGLINLRGQIIMTIDLRKQLGFEENTSSSEPMSMVVRSSDGPVNLLVDKIGDVIYVHPDLFERSPKTLDSRLGWAIDGVYKLKGKLLLALNTESITRVS